MRKQKNFRTEKRFPVLFLFVKQIIFPVFSFFFRISQEIFHLSPSIT